MPIPFDRALSYAAGAVRAGVSLDRLLEVALIPSSTVRGDAGVGKPSLLLLHLAAMNGAGDESHGLAEIGIPLGTASLALRAMLGSHDFDRAITSFQQVYNLSGPTIRIDREEHGDRVTLSARVSCTTQADAQLLEDTSVNWMWACLSRFLDGPLPVVQVTTRDPVHPNLGSRHWVCGAKLKLAGAASVTFPRSLLAARRRAEPSIDAVFQCYSHAFRFMQARDASTTFATGSMQSLIRAECVSGSTLRRRLTTQCGGYRMAHEAAVLNRALSLLRETTFSVDAIAVELGYSDARSFRRFFKSAVRATPQEIREGRATGIECCGDEQKMMMSLRNLTATLDR